MNPCNAGIQPLVDRAMAALKDAGAMPQVFGVPTITDGIGMGTEAMKYSLVSREVIADAIETSVNGQAMDGVLVVRRLRQEHARRHDGDRAHERAGDLRLRRHHQAGQVEGPGPHHRVSPFEAVGAFTAGKMIEGGFRSASRRTPVPSVGACGGMYTANTMSSSFEALGMSLLGSSQMASPDAGESRTRPPSRRKVLVDAIKKNIRPRDIITRKSIENAIALVMATGGSTNAVLHLPRDRFGGRGRSGPSTTSSACASKVPVLCDLKPSGKYVAVDFHRAGGVPQVLKMLLATACCTASA